MKRSHRQVAVILNADVPDVGFAGELHTVKTGFARNFLLAKQVAEIATPQLLKQREAEMAKAAERRQAEVKSRDELATKLSAQPVELQLNIGSGGQVFGSLSASDIVAAIKKQRDIVLESKQLTGVPIKTIGRSTVSAKLGIGVVAEIPLQVTGKQVRKKNDSAKDSDQAQENATDTDEAPNDDTPAAQTETLAPTS